MLCAARSLVKEEPTRGLAVSLLCRSWGCPTCQPIRQSQLQKLAADGNPNRFVTLTVNPKLGAGPAARAAMLARAWRVVVKRAKRQLGLGKVEYLAVFEATRRGEPHLHILLRSGFIRQRWLSEQMQELMSAPIVDIREVKSAKQAAHYVAKYVGKQPGKFGTSKRYWCTRQWRQVKTEKKRIGDDIAGKWQQVDEPVWAVFDRWERECRAAVHVDEHCAYYGQAPPHLSDWAEPIAVADLQPLHVWAADRRRQKEDEARRRDPWARAGAGRACL